MRNIEKKVEIVANSEDAKMLTLKMDELDDDARMVVQAVRLGMFKRTKGQLEREENEVAEKEKADNEAAETTPMTR